MIPRLTAAELRRLRLAAQGLEPVSSRSPAEAVAHAVALQGQDLPSVLRAIALRSAPGTTVDQVRDAFDRGELVRGWTQRGTLFATTPTGLAALSALTAERTARTLPGRQAVLGLDASTLARAEEVARGLLAGGGATRARFRAAWEAAGIATGGQRGYHLIHAFSLAGMMHWGPFDSAEAGEQLLVATPVPSVLDVEETLTELVRGYLRSHGPVRPDEAAWWLGLPKTAIRRAIATLGAEVVRVEVEGDAHLLLAEDLDEAETERGVQLVPGFDEIYLGYQLRDLIASALTQRAIVPGANGVFRPAVLVDGYVVGTWRRNPRRGEAAVDLTESLPRSTRSRIDAALQEWPHG